MIFVLSAVALAGTATATAQAPERPVAELIPGVTFIGDGSVELTQTAEGLPIVSFWRPLLFGSKKRPVAGRMDCKITAARSPYSKAGFDLEATVAREAKLREGPNGYKADDKHTHREINDDVRRIDVVGMTYHPHADYVLTYIAIRTEADIVDIRRNCRFVHDNGEGKPDWLGLVNRHTALLINLPSALPLDRLADDPDNEGA